MPTAAATALIRVVCTAAVKVDTEYPPNTTVMDTVVGAGLGGGGGGGGDADGTGVLPEGVVGRGGWRDVLPEGVGRGGWCEGGGA